MNIENAHKVTPLCKAIGERKLDCVRVLLEAGACPDALQGSDYSPLNIATAIDEVRCVRLLLAFGADASLPCGDQNATILWDAAMQGRMEIVVEILNFGGHANSKKIYTVADLARGNSAATICTPLHGAVHHKADAKAIAMIRLLTDAGAHVNTPLGPYKHTVLMYAVAQKRMQLIRALVESFGASVDAKTKSGETSLILAVEGSFSEVSITQKGYSSYSPFVVSRT